MMLANAATLVTYTQNVMRQAVYTVSHMPVALFVWCCSLVSHVCLTLALMCAQLWLLVALPLCHMFLQPSSMHAHSN